MKPLLTTRQAAERLGCSGDQIRALVAAGCLRAIRLPARGGRGQLRIYRDSVDGYAEIAVLVSLRWVSLPDASWHLKLPQREVLALVDDGKLNWFKTPREGKGGLKIWIDLESIDDYSIRRGRPFR